MRSVLSGSPSGGSRRRPARAAAAALLPDRVIAVAALASVAPYDADGLDFLEGMGEQNVEEFGKIFEGEDTHRASMEKQREELLSATPEQLVDLWQRCSGRPIGRWRPECWRPSCSTTFAPGSARAETAGSTTILRSSRRDSTSPRSAYRSKFGRGSRTNCAVRARRLARRAHPRVDARLTAEDGHLTLAERRVPGSTAGYWNVPRSAVECPPRNVPALGRMHDVRGKPRAARQAAVSPLRGAVPTRGESRLRSGGRREARHASRRRSPRRGEA